MTDPNDSLDSVADPGPAGDDEPEERPGDETRHVPDEGGAPGVAADSPAAQGSPVGPPD